MIIINNYYRQLNDVAVKISWLYVVTHPKAN